MSGSLVRQRIYSLDLLRGLVMVIMALDHTRDFFHFDAFVHDPLDPDTTTPVLFFTRWITHYCAPIFVFLAGMSIYLQGLRKSPAELGGFLVKRGLWLLFVECVLITYAWTFDHSFPAIVLQVIAAIGFSMLAMAALIRLSYSVMLVVGLLIVLGHNVLDFVPATHQGFWWDLLLNGNFATYHFASDHQAVIIYPLLPWLGVMMLGYCAGRFYAPDHDAAARRRVLMRLGLGLVIAFVLLRALNVYGDPHPWVSQGSFVRTALSFLNAHKYPPSLLFLCMTLGPALIFLSLAEPLNNRLTRALSVYGRVPFFYYVLHFYLLHLLCMLLFLARGHAFNEQTPDIFGIPFHFMLKGEGYSLRIVYLIWAGVVLALYPACLWFSRLKQRSKAWWLSYL